MSDQQSSILRGVAVIFVSIFFVHFALTFCAIPTWATTVGKLFESVGNAPAQLSTSEIVVTLCTVLLSLPLFFTRQLEHAAFLWPDVQRGITPQIIRLVLNSLVYAIVLTSLVLLCRFSDVYASRPNQIR